MHTPGPWGTLKVANSIGIVPLGKNGKPREGRETEDVATVSLFSYDEASDNARLLAAAPDLLACLKRIVAAWESIPERDQVNEEMNLDGMWANARDAIAKAEPS